MNVEQGSYFEAGDQGKENLDLESALKDVYSLLVEMDQKRFDIFEIKNYIAKNVFDEVGNIKPERMEFLTKMINKKYYDEYLRSEKYLDYIRSEMNGRQESEYKADKPFYGMSFEGTFEAYGEKYPNSMVLDRISVFEWVTKEVGSGYSVFAGQFPEWLNFNHGEWEETNRVEIDDDNYKIEYLAKAFLNDGTEFKLFKTFRSHLGGKCEKYRLRFDSRTDADKFGKYLWETEQVQIRAEKKDD